jgi:hypothetical protein
MASEKIDRIGQLKKAGMVFDDPPSPGVVRKINALSDKEFKTLLELAPKLKTTKAKLSLKKHNGGFQNRSGAE